MDKEGITLTGKFLYKNPRANLTQTPPVIRNKNDIETIKELQQINFKLQQENKKLKEKIDEAIEYILLDKSSTDTFSKRENAIKIIFTKEELDLLEILKGDK